MIIDGGNNLNIASWELVEKLNLPTKRHPNPFQVAWVNDTPIPKFKNLVLPQDNLQKAYEKQLSANLLKPHNYFENYQLVLQRWKVNQNLAIALHEIIQDQERRISYLIMVKKR